MRRGSPIKSIIGIDEVGRGALAGPVTVAAVCIPKGLTIRKPHPGILRDSKKLSSSQRERWFAYFKRHLPIRYSVARVYPRGIERLNISKAANLAATRACNRLIRVCKLSAKSGSASGGKIENCKIFLDGGLYLENRNKREKTQIPTRNGAEQFCKDSRAVSQYFVSTIIRGDEKIMAIAIASIIAKVNRDGYMERLSKKYPQYGFEIHKGYGTKKHFRAIRQRGVSPAHRLTFLRKYTKINSK